MSESNIAILVESLKKKIRILNEIKEQNELQAKAIDAEEFDDELFEATISKKEELITSLVFLDTGFDSVYNRVKVELSENKEKYADEIRDMQDLIRRVTDLGVEIRASESRNEVNLKNRFRNEHQKIRQSKATVKAVTGYYQSMNGMAAGDSSMLDQKK